MERKYFKVEVKRPNSITSEFNVYCLTKEEAEKYVREYNIKPNSANMRASVASEYPVTLTELHTATTRGYWRKGDNGKRTPYRGKFGVGFIEHTATCASNTSNSFHEITYFVELKK